MKYEYYYIVGFEGPMIYRISNKKIEYRTNDFGSNSRERGDWRLSIHKNVYDLKIESTTEAPKKISEEEVFALLL